ncbi:MAG: YggS family pyridoxal phosphate-dependent enzyme [Spirochaetia bacterium]|nr:YggS family pyridoxal phosphate-dependent enzyme [Spirochaetia bacterium]
MGQIADRLGDIRKNLPSGVKICAAAKTRNADEIREALEAGIDAIGMNYLQEGLRLQNELGESTSAVFSKTSWHFIGPIQSNKTSQIAGAFDLIQTVDRFKIADLLNKRAGENGKTISILIEVNSGREEQKHGVLPEAVLELIASLSPFTHLRISGLMTMGPALEGASLRPFFKETARLYESLKTLNQENLFPEILSMGMSDSYREAVDEGANWVRIGTAIFGPRLTKSLS